MLLGGTMALDGGEVSFLKKWPLHKFLIVGALNTVIGGLIIFCLMYAFDANPFLANCIGYGCGFVLSYFLNSNWTFNARYKSFKNFAWYVVVLLISYLMNLLVLYVGTILYDCNKYLVQLLAMATYTLLSFVGSRVFVFKMGNNGTDVNLGE